MESDATHTDMNALLESLDTYILSLIRKNLALMSGYHIHFTSGSPEVDEIAQCVRINLWRISQQKEIVNPKAYIRPIVHNEIINILRKKYAVDLLSLSQVDELFYGHVLISPGEGMGDPAYEVEQQELVHLSIDQVSKAVAKLAPRQQKVVICMLRDLYDYFPVFAIACKNYGISTDKCVWPTGRQDKQRLKANLSSARRSIRAILV